MKTYTDFEIEYAAGAHCDICGAGLAHPLNGREALQLGAWVCSKELKSEFPDGAHSRYPFAFYKIREESSINNRSGSTTRPKGTLCLTKGEATCPKCGTWWEGEPYNANGLSHHWFSGDCPTCGYNVGGNGSYSSNDGKPIETRYRTIVVADPQYAEAEFTEKKAAQP